MGHCRMRMSKYGKQKECVCVLSRYSDQGFFFISWLCSIAYNKSDITTTTRSIVRKRQGKSVPYKWNQWKQRHKIIHLIIRLIWRFVVSICRHISIRLVFFLFNYSHLEFNIRVSAPVIRTLWIIQISNPIR